MNSKTFNSKTQKKTFYICKAFKRKHLCLLSALALAVHVSVAHMASGCCGLLLLYHNAPEGSVVFCLTQRRAFYSLFFDNGLKLCPGRGPRG